MIIVILLNYYRFIAALLLIITVLLLYLIHDYSVIVAPDLAWMDLLMLQLCCPFLLKLVCFYPLPNYGLA